jgi:hypothetical protein
VSCRSSQESTAGIAADSARRCSTSPQWEAPSTLR